MNKFTYALTLGAGLVFGLATPDASASSIVQNLTPTDLSAAQFNANFAPITSVLSQNYQFMNNAQQNGVVESQVFQGAGQYAGLYAYAYQFAVAPTSDNSGAANYVNSASLTFNATPQPADLTGTGTTTPNASVYVVKDGQIGGINIPQAAPGATVQVPSSVAWQTAANTGSLTFQYLDATSNTSPLLAGATSGTIVVLTNDSKTTQPFVSLQNANPQNGYPQAYAPTAGTIDQIPAPEPATIIGWTSVVGALALVRRVRRGRKAA